MKKIILTVEYVIQRLSQLAAIIHQTQTVIAKVLKLMAN